MTEKSKSPLTFNNFSTNSTTYNLSPSSKVHYDLFTKLKFKQFTNIFKILDQDEDGMINHINSSIRNIPSKVAKLLKPIFGKMEDQMKNYSLQQFVNECDEIFKVSYFLTIEIDVFRKKTPDKFQQT